MLTYTKAFSGFSVDNIEKAKQFYAETLGLETTVFPEGLQVRTANGIEIFIYEKPNHVPATYTVLNFEVVDVEAAVDELVRSGVKFEHYDEEFLKTDAKGIAHSNGHGPTIAWFKDPAGNFLSVLKPNN